MMTRRTHLDLLAVVILVASCLFWGFQQVLVKATLPEVPPVFQAALRFLGATAVLWCWCRWRGVALWAQDGSLKPGLLAGLLFTAEFVALYLALQHAPASRVTIFLYTSPFWVALVLPLLIPAERLRTVQWLGLALAFVAVAFALREGWGQSTAATVMPWLGDVLAIAAGAFWGLTTVVIRNSTLMRVSPEKLLFYQVSLSALLLPIVSWALGEAWTWQLSGFAWGSVLLQCVVGAFASYLAWMWMLGRYPATLISSFVFLTPVFAMGFGAWWLGEALTPSVLIASAGVAVGIVLVNRKPAA